MISSWQPWPSWVAYLASQLLLIAPRGGFLFRPLLPCAAGCCMSILQAIRGCPGSLDENDYTGNRWMTLRQDSTCGRYSAVGL